MRITKKRIAAVGAGAALVLAGGGLALAYWTTTGSGSGSAVNSNGTSDLTITQTSTITDLAPGVAAEPIGGTIKNNAANSAHVASVTVSITSVSPAANAPSGTCDATDYTLADGTMTVNQDVAPAGVVTFSGATLSFNDKATANQDACKGATVNLAYSSN